jgi:hypothetical protein
MRRAALALPLLFVGCSTQTNYTLADGSPPVRLVAAAYDQGQHEATCKPWHAVHAPDGRLLTKGLGGTFPHHRGLFVGWNQVDCHGARLDFWHCRNGETPRVRQHEPAADGERLTVDWCAADGRPIVQEVRSLRVSPWRDGGYRVDLEHTLRAAGAEVVLGGDPQHAGCQFRALEAFAPATAPKVGYVRPPTAIGAANDVWHDCRWIAAILPLPDGAITVLRIEAAGNPTATWSTRGYGRFGAMWTLALPADGTPQRLATTWLVVAGERDAAWCGTAAAAALAGS